MGRASGSCRVVAFLSGLLALLSLPAPPVRADGVLSAGNGIYRIHVSDNVEDAFGSYTATTGADHPAGEGLNVLYGDGRPWSSFTTVRSFTSGTDYVMGDPNGQGYGSPLPMVDLTPYGVVTPLGSRGYRTTYTLPGPPATPDALVLLSDVLVEGDGYERSAITVSTSVANRGASPVRFGVRYLWDLQIGEDDGPTFQAVGPDGPVLVTEEEFPFPRMESYRIADNDRNPSPPTFVVLGSVTGDTGYGSTAPGLLQYVGWPRASGEAFDYLADPLTDVATEGSAGDNAVRFNDSAVLYFFGEDGANALSAAPGAEVRVTANLYLTPPPPPSGTLSVAVDVRPGSDRNPVNLGEKGTVPAAVLGTAELPAGRIDPGTVSLEDVPALRGSLADADGDGTADLVLHFDARALAASVTGRLGRPPADGEAVLLFLRGRLRADHGGGPFEGADTATFLAKKGSRR